MSLLRLNLFAQINKGDAMAKVRVWNDNVHPYKEEFRSHKVDIAPGKFMIMEEDEAIMLLGNYSPIITDGDGLALPTSYKMLHIEKISDDDAKASPVQICAACSYKASSEKDLEEHVDANHLDELSDSKVADERRKKKKAS
jgi:hypothetical protein